MGEVVDEDVKMKVSEEIRKGRQAWFWRRTTLQVTLVVLLSILGTTLYQTSLRDINWQTVTVECALMASVVWLITMYFAMVDSAAKVSSVVGAIGDAVDKAVD